MTSLNINLLSSTIPDAAPSNYITEIRYPAGETQIRLTAEGCNVVNAANSITIRAQICNAQDIVRLLLLKDAIDGMSGSADLITLYLPYLPYGRADRAFVPGDCFGLEIFANLINTARFDSVESLDPHNPIVSECVFKHFVARSPLPYIENAIADFLDTQNRAGAQTLTILFPDKGAQDRYGVILPNNIEGNRGSVKLIKQFCTKLRDVETGKLSGFEVPALDRALPALIIDDICDGGGTFIGIAEKISEDIHLGLYVTHGIFSQGLKRLNEHFNQIYTTDSFPRLSDEGLTIVHAR